MLLKKPVNSNSGITSTGKVSQFFLYPMKGKTGITTLYSFQFCVLYKERPQEGCTAIVSTGYYTSSFNLFPQVLLEVGTSIQINSIFCVIWSCRTSVIKLRKIEWNGCRKLYFLVLPLLGLLSKKENVRISDLFSH